MRTYLTRVAALFICLVLSAPVQASVCHQLFKTIVPAPVPMEAHDMLVLYTVPDRDDQIVAELLQRDVVREDFKHRRNLEEGKTTLVWRTLQPLNDDWRVHKDHYTGIPVFVHQKTAQAFAARHISLIKLLQLINLDDRLHVMRVSHPDNPTEFDVELGISGFRWHDVHALHAHHASRDNKRIKVLNLDRATLVGDNALFDFFAENRAMYVLGHTDSDQVRLEYLPASEDPESVHGLLGMSPDRYRADVASRRDCLDVQGRVVHTTQDREHDQRFRAYKRPVEVERVGTYTSAKCTLKPQVYFPTPATWRERYSEQVRWHQSGPFANRYVQEWRRGSFGRFSADQGKRTISVVGTDWQATISLPDGMRVHSQRRIALFDESRTIDLEYEVGLVLIDSRGQAHVVEQGYLLDLMRVIARAPEELVVLRAGLANPGTRTNEHRPLFVARPIWTTDHKPSVNTRVRIDQFLAHLLPRREQYTNVSVVPTPDRTLINAQEPRCFDMHSIPFGREGEIPYSYFVTP